ncbi:CCR4-associated factor 1-like protein 11 [Pyrus ussuriensis x Pyrus communis]|uniref:CCR4-associated factor 1-like protein 11 n=1 Tax=Pyrus ussuriensis x Pyrus communis TaxID=2448454 RepID=A0A5N5FC40_9ROSA|nr:CCR4-associated factor 1-like protein 11 [Pyrus ussuriensis x Pyrus communis]
MVEIGIVGVGSNHDAREFDVHGNQRLIVSNSRLSDHTEQIRMSGGGGGLGGGGLDDDEGVWVGKTKAF